MDDKHHSSNPDGLEADLSPEFKRLIANMGLNSPFEKGIYLYNDDFERPKPIMSGQFKPRPIEPDLTFSYINYAPLMDFENKLNQVLHPYTISDLKDFLKWMEDNKK
jgi:hypothetical protein